MFCYFPGYHWNRTVNIINILPPFSFRISFPLLSRNKFDHYYQSLWYLSNLSLSPTNQLCKRFSERKNRAYLTSKVSFKYHPSNKHASRTNTHLSNKVAASWCILLCLLQVASDMYHNKKILIALHFVN